MKQYNSRRVILIGSGILAVAFTTGLLFFIVAPASWPPWLKVISGALFVFFVAVLVLEFIYNRFFKIRITDIYRNIARLRNLKEKTFSSHQDHLVDKEINGILKVWSDESREEIDHLKQVEIYRREFLSNVSHELKTPIFSVQGYIHTLIDGGIEDQEVNTLYLNKASRSIDRLISIVDDLESISKMEAGELIVEQRTFDIVDLSKDVIESLELQAREKNVRLYINENNDKPVYVFADKDLVRQVIVNLLVNSVKYGKRDGKTELRFAEQGEQVNIDIEDDGIGIEKRHLPRLFERFYRVDKSRSRDQGGTGLGLAIVKHIIEAHQQSIVVESVVDKGTVFSFSLKKSK